MSKFSPGKEVLKGAIQYEGNITLVTKYLRICHMKKRLNLFEMREPIRELYWKTKFSSMEGGKVALCYLLADPFSVEAILPLRGQNLIVGVVGG